MEIRDLFFSLKDNMETMSTVVLSTDNALR